MRLKLDKIKGIYILRLFMKDIQKLEQKVYLISLLIISCYTYTP
jgi:hypothetical protein